ncbi:MAG: hypothetical protein PVI79_04260 [Gammaproteobacteria bacterium]|jgi:hypothetical protein
MSRFVLVLVSVLLGNTAIADVQFEMRDFSGQTSLVSSNGDRSRIDNSRMPGYAIVDHDSGEFMMVDPERREILVATPGAGGVTVGDEAISVSLEDEGGGQKIAGYETRKYRFIASGERCGTIYGSRKLMHDDRVRMMFEAMRGMQNISRRMTAGLSGVMPLCQRANLQLSGAMDSAGVPMRVLDAGGKTLSEIVSVDIDKSLPADYYQAPAGMTRVDMNAKMNQAAEQMRNIPDMNQMMEQMQQGGAQMTPEMQEQMKQQMDQLQNMLKQMEQQ